jgi:hypothetical protein
VQGKACLLGELIIGLISLFPCKPKQCGIFMPSCLGLLEDGLFEAAIYKTSNANEANKANESIEPNEYGFPLSVFTKVAF